MPAGPGRGRGGQPVSGRRSPAEGGEGGPSQAGTRAGAWRVVRGSPRGFQAASALQLPPRPARSGPGAPRGRLRRAPCLPPPGAASQTGSAPCTFARDIGFLCRGPEPPQPQACLEACELFGDAADSGEDCDLQLFVCGGLVGWLPAQEAEGFGLIIQIILRPRKSNCLVTRVGSLHL